MREKRLYPGWGVEKLRGVESKFNEQDPSQGQLNSDYSSFKISIEFTLISLGVLHCPRELENGIYLRSFYIYH